MRRGSLRWPLAALGRFLHNAADESDLIALASFAPDAASRRFVVEGLAPAAAPAGNLVALLGYAHALAARTPELWPLVLPAARAVEAYDRPLLVAVMGEFNAGKSSFVNALCGEEIAPVGVTPTTATINILRHGPMGGRASYHDGQVRDLDASSVAPFLRGLGADEAAAIRVVEIFYPLEVLRRVEVVDTPGLNSLRPEHESVARDFLVDADAIVWLFAVGQAAKATEKQALALAQAAGKRVLGRAQQDRSRQRRRGRAGLGACRGEPGRSGRGDRSDLGAPRPGSEAGAGGRWRRNQRQRRQDGARRRRARARRSAPDDGGFAALETALEQRFFRHARALKRDTALGALRRFVTEARAKTGAGSEPSGTPARDFAAERRALTAAEHRVRGALAGERIGLRARIDEAYRSAAFEVREFVRPRSWLFGEHRADAADEEFLIDLLDEAIGRATEQTRVALETALAAPDTTPAMPPPPGFAAAFEHALERAIERFRAYARGVLEGGAVAEFFRHDLPRIRLDLGAIRNALARRAPDPEDVLFRVLDRETGLALDGRAARARPRRCRRRDRVAGPQRAGRASAGPAGRSDRGSGARGSSARRSLTGRVDLPEAGVDAYDRRRRARRKGAREQPGAGHRRGGARAGAGGDGAGGGGAGTPGLAAFVAGRSRRFEVVRRRARRARGAPRDGPPDPRGRRRSSPSRCATSRPSTPTSRAVRSTCWSASAPSA